MDESGPPPSGPSSASDTEKRDAAAEHERRAREKALRLEHEIASLRTAHLGEVHRDYHAFFEHERRIQALFKELSPLAAGDRHRLWDALTRAGTEARRAQQDEWESRRYQSIEARETVEEKLREAGGLTQGTQGAAGYRRAEALLNEVRALLGSRQPDSPGQLLIGPDRRACWDRWRQVRDGLKRVRDLQQEQDYRALATPLTEVNECARDGDPHEAIRRVKELRPARPGLPAARPVRGPAPAPLGGLAGRAGDSSGSARSARGAATSGARAWRVTSRAGAGRSSRSGGSASTCSSR